MSTLPDHVARFARRFLLACAMLLVGSLVAMPTHAADRAKNTTPAPVAKAAASFVADAEMSEFPPVVTYEAAFDRDLLKNIHGVSLRRFARIAHEVLAAGPAKADAVYRRHGLSSASYQQLQEGWTQRMRDDPTTVLSRLYGAWFAENATGKVEALGKDVANSYLNRVPLAEEAPLSGETFLDAQKRISRKAQFVKDVSEMDEIVKPYGYTYAEWLIVANWMTRQMTQTYDIRDQSSHGGGVVIEARQP